MCSGRHISLSIFKKLILSLYNLPINNYLQLQWADEAKEARGLAKGEQRDIAKSYATISKGLLDQPSGVWPDVVVSRESAA